MVRVRLSSPLRRYSSGNEYLKGNGATVAAVIRDALSSYPELSAKVLKPDNSIHSQILVYKDGKILNAKCEDESVDEGSEISLLLFIGGG